MMRVERSFGTEGLAEKTLLRTLNQVWLPVLQALLRNFNGLQVSDTFTSADLVADILTYEHSLNSSIVSVTLIDNLGVIRDDVGAAQDISVVDSNNVRVDLSGYGMAGTWSILVRRD